MNRDDIRLVFRRLSNFEELYLVGGSIRDLLLNIPITDFDFAVPYTPKQIKEKLKECGIHSTFDVGEKFGTIGFVLCSFNVEITTFRGEQYNYLDRKPVVSYIQDIEEDVKRRDFTINSLYLSREEFKKFDSLVTDSILLTFDNLIKDKHRKQGVLDLINKEIRTVGDSARRFKEDPLRMLRAVRFAIKYNFTITEKTLDMIQRLRVELLKVSVERWTQELDKILFIESPNLQVLAASCLLDIMIPELSYQIGFDQNSRYHNHQLWEHTMKVVKAVPSSDLNLRWSALLHDIGKPFVKTVNKQGKYNYMGHEVMSAYLVKQIGLRLKWSKERTVFVGGLVEHHLQKYCSLKKYDDESKKGITEICQ